MIRMGRSNNKSEQPNEPSPYQENYQKNSGGAYPSRQEAVPTTATSRGALSESEAMARDIKEGRLSGFVGHGTVLTGETTFHAMLRIDGHLTGRVTSENGTLIIGSSGRVDANILVAVAVINGTVNGDVIALEKVELGRSARLMGNIQSPRVVIEDGAIFEGSCAMIKAKEVVEQRAAEAKAQTAAQQIQSYEPAENVEDAAEFTEAAAS